MNRITSNVDFPSFFMRLGRAKGLSGGGGLPMPFEANVPDPSTGEMLGVAEGVGGLTESASTSILVPDYQGVSVEVPANTPAWDGGRVVSNYMPEPNDMQVSPWIATSGATVVSPTEIVLSDNPISRVVALIGSDLTAGDWRVSVEMRSDEIDTVRLEVGLDQTDVVEVSGITTEWQRFSVLITNIDLETDWYSGVLRSGQSGTLFCRNWLTEPVYGQSNQNPSTFQDYGTKTFARMNGNTVTDNIVNEALGAWIDPLPRLVYAPEKTNLMTYARDILIPWTASALAENSTAIGIDGTANATQVEDQSVETIGRIEGYINGLIPSTNDYGLALSLGVSASTAYCRIEFRLLGGTTSEFSVIRIRYSDGDSVVSGVSADDYKIVRIGDFYRIFMKRKDSGLNGTMQVRIYPMFNFDGSATEDPTVTGSAIIDAVEVLTAPTLYSDNEIENPPVFTAGTQVTRTARALSFDIANHNNAVGGYYIELTLPVSQLPTLRFEVLSTNIYSVAYIHNYGATFWSADQSGAIGTSRPERLPNVTMRLGVIYSADENRKMVMVDGAESEEDSFSGYTLTDKLMLCRIGSVCAKIGPIRRYEGTFDEMKAQLEADIAAGEAA